MFSSQSSKNRKKVFKEKQVYSVHGVKFVMNRGFNLQKTIFFSQGCIKVISGVRGFPAPFTLKLFTKQALFLQVYTPFVKSTFC